MLVRNVETCMKYYFFYFEALNISQYGCGFSIFLFFNFFNLAMKTQNKKCKSVCVLVIVRFRSLLRS